MSPAAFIFVSFCQPPANNAPENYTGVHPSEGVRGTRIPPGGPSVEETQPLKPPRELKPLRMTPKGLRGALMAAGSRHISQRNATGPDVPG